MIGDWGKPVDGRQILRDIKEQLAGFRNSLREKGSRVAIIHFADPGEGYPEIIRTRVRAADVSTRAKLKTFSALGAEPIDIPKPWTTSPTEFIKTISALNEDPSVAGIIVQHPMQEVIRRRLNQIAPEKDLDTLTIRQENPFQVPATSDAILRVATAFTQSEAVLRTVEPYIEDNPLIAVVGAQGFVGSGVVRQLRQRGASVLALDARALGFTPDDLRQVAEVDIVISTVGQPEILDERHLRPHHRVVIDCGFSPIGEEVYGDVKKSAYNIPQNITPVPGGIGPTEMAILAERLVKKEVAPELESWTLEKQEYLTRDEVAEVQQQWAQDIYQTAKIMLDMSPNPRGLEGTYYRIALDEHTGNLSIYSKDRRGLVAEYSQNADTVTYNNLSKEDSVAWQQIRQILNEQTVDRTQPDIEL
ncbi:MAG: tetrahydrofolate dehydrogenase/cyclohydrolase catalytic domain-containing protein [Cyanobacteria bacterium J06635_15]